MGTYECVPCNKFITKFNKPNHERTISYKQFIKDDPSFKTGTNCKRVQEETNFF